MEETWIGRGAFAHVVKIGKYPPHLAAKYIRIVYGNCREFYEREFKVLQKLRHPNIVNYYGMCETRKDHDSYYVIHMEFCERLSLRHVLKDAEVIYSMKTILGWAEHLTSALLYLKNSQIIHRDIKPENILVTNDFVLKLGDFGFVKEINGTQYSMSVAGTDRYVSPESSGFIREITATYKSDLYSVGLVLWEIVERRKIFEEYEDEKFKAFALFEDLRMGAFRLKFSYCDDEFKEVILRCTNFNPEMRPEVEQVHAQVVQMNESSPMESFLPIIEPNQKHPLKPVPLQRNNQEIQSFHSENTELSITIPNISMSPSKSQSHDEMIIELTLENERTEIPLKITLKEAISNLKMLAIRGDKKLLKAIENQIKKCTRFPDDYIICIDEMPKFPPIIDQKLIRFFQLRKYPKSLIKHIEISLKICEQCLREEFKKLLSGFVQAIHWEYKASRKEEISEMIHSIAEIYKIIGTLSDNFFYKQWFTRAFYDAPDRKWMLLSRKRKLFIRGYHEMIIMKGEFRGNMEYFQEDGVEKPYKLFLNRGYHIEELLVDLKYRLKSKQKEIGDSLELECLMQSFHLSKRAFPYTSYIFQLGKSVSECEEIKNSDIDYESLSDYETLRRTYEIGIRLLQIEKKLTAKHIVELKIVSEIERCAKDLMKTRNCPNYLLFYNYKIDWNDLASVKVLLKLPGKNGQKVPIFRRGLVNFEAIHVEPEDVEKTGYSCVDVNLISKRLLEMLENVQSMVQMK